MTNKTTLMDPAIFQAKASEAAALLRAMSNESRLRVLCRLAAEEVSVSEMQADIGLSQSALSQHLAVLRSGGFVATRREGQVIYYRLADPAVIQVIETLATIYCPEMLK